MEIMLVPCLSILLEFASMLFLYVVQGFWFILLSKRSMDIMYQNAADISVDAASTGLASHYNGAPLPDSYFMRAMTT